MNTDHLRKLFARVLGLDEVLPHDNFFELGGHSLLAAQLVEVIQREDGVAVTVEDVTADPTPESLARRLAAHGLPDSADVQGGGVL